MHTPNDPQKYLRKNFEKKYSVSGIPFLDYRWRAFIGTQPSTTRVTILTFTSWCTATDLKSPTSHGKVL